MDAQMKGIESNMKRMVLSNRRDITENVDEHLDRVLGQVKGVIDAGEEQERLLEAKVERMVQKMIDSPSGVNTTETVIIQQQQEVQKAQDHGLLSKLKNSVNAMELDHTKSQNLIERLAEQCEMASERAKTSEAKANQMEELILQTTQSLSSEFEKSLVDQMAAMNETMDDMSTAAATSEADNKAAHEEEMQTQLALLTGKMKKEISDAAAQHSETLSALQATQAESIAALEERQKVEIKSIVAAAEADGNATSLHDMKQAKEEIILLKEQLAALSDTSTGMKTELQEETKKVEEKVRRQSMAQVQLVSKQMTTKNQEFDTRVEEMNTAQSTTQVVVQSVKENVEEFVEKLQKQINSLKKDVEDKNKLLTTMQMSTKQKLSSNLSELDEKISKMTQRLEDEVQVSDE